jgi:hypothetical protein
MMAFWTTKSFSSTGYFIYKQSFFFPVPFAWKDFLPTAFSGGDIDGVLAAMVALYGRIEIQLGQNLGLISFHNLSPLLL